MGSNTITLLSKDSCLLNLNPYIPGAKTSNMYCFPSSLTSRSPYNLFISRCLCLGSQLCDFGKTLGFCWVGEFAQATTTSSLPALLTLLGWLLTLLSHHLELPRNCSSSHQHPPLGFTLPLLPLLPLCVCYWTFTDILVLHSLASVLL